MAAEVTVEGDGRRWWWWCWKRKRGRERGHLLDSPRLPPRQRGTQLIELQARVERAERRLARVGSGDRRDQLLVERLRAGARVERRHDALAEGGAPEHLRAEAGGSVEVGWCAVSRGGRWGGGGAGEEEEEAVARRTSEPPMLKTPDAPLSRSILVAAARSRLYVGVFTWFGSGRGEG